LYGTPEQAADKASATELAVELTRSELLELLLARFSSLEFECRKDVAQVFSNLLRKQREGEQGAVAWLSSSPHILIRMMEAYAEALPEVTLSYGLMLREASRHERLATTLLHSEPTFPALFRCIDSPHFDVASDAFATCRELLTRHKAVVSTFLQEHYERFFTQYMQLVRSSNYVTKRQSLKLMGELLLDRAYFPVMTRFIASVEHLKTVMVLLRDPSASIAYEAFHVFKIFVANPRKDGQVLELLLRNKERMLTFLATFLSQREAQDENFRDEKGFLIDEIHKL